MSTKEQTVTLLRRNKRAMVDALQGNGYAGTSYSMRAADFPQYVKWGSGLLDLRVCAVKIADGSLSYYTVEEWGALTNENRALFVKKGLRVRAHGEDILIAPETLAAVPQYTAITNVADYKAHTLEQDGVADTFTWRLPTRHQLTVLYRYRTEIDEAFSTAWSSAIALSKAWHWSKSLQSGTNYWAVHTGSGYYNSVAQGTNYVSRPVYDYREQGEGGVEEAAEEES